MFLAIFWTDDRSKADFSESVLGSYRQVSSGMEDSGSSFVSEKFANKLLIYRTFLWPILTYGALGWSSASKSLLNRFNILQNPQHLGSLIMHKSIGTWTCLFLANTRWHCPKNHTRGHQGWAIRSSSTWGRWILIGPRLPSTFVASSRWTVNTGRNLAGHLWWLKITTDWAGKSDLGKIGRPSRSFGTFSAQIKGLLRRFIVADKTRVHH